MASADKLRKIIELTVQKEIRRVLPELIKEAFSGLVAEGVQRGLSEVVSPRGTRSNGNSAKRKALTESTRPDMEEYPTMTGRTFDRTRMAELMGLSEGFETVGEAGEFITTPASRTSGELIVSSGHTEQGTEVPVDPDSLPDHLKNALTRNYSDVMKALNGLKNGS